MRDSGIFSKNNRDEFGRILPIKYALQVILSDIGQWYIQSPSATKFVNRFKEIAAGVPWKSG
jgi:hypothetical protein